MNATTTSTDNKTRLPEMTATTNGWWGKLRILVFGVNSSQKINIYHWKCVGKGLGENGMNELAKWK
jgi:hypothetical protein